MASSKKSVSTANMERGLISKDGIITGISKNPKKMCLPPNTFLKNPRMIDISTLSGPMHIIQSSNLNILKGNNEPVNDVNNEDGTTITNIENAFINDIPIDNLSDLEIHTIVNKNYNRQEKEEQQEQEQEEKQHEQEEEEEEEEANRHHHNPVVCCSHCRQQRKQFEQLILRTLTRSIELNREDNRGAAQQLRNVSLLPPMPFNDIERLQRFDNDLRENERLREQFKGKIQEIGGKNLQKAVKFSMETVMTDQLSQKVVWVLGADNIPKISKFQFPYLIIDVIRSAFDGIKIKSIEERMAEWIRRAGDRLKAATVAENKRRGREQNQERG